MTHLKKGFVLEGVMNLGDRHRAALEPAVEDVIHTPQRPTALARRDGNVIDKVPMQIRNLRRVSLQAFGFARNACVALMQERAPTPPSWCKTSRPWKQISCAIHYRQSLIRLRSMFQPSTLPCGPTAPPAAQRSR